MNLGVTSQGPFIHLSQSIILQKPTELPLVNKGVSQASAMLSSYLLAERKVILMSFYNSGI